MKILLIVFLIIQSACLQQPTPKVEVREPIEAPTPTPTIVVKKTTKDDLKSYEEVLKLTSEVKFIDSIIEGTRSANQIKITLKDQWHYLPYQIRLQKAQGLWKLWATIHAPENVDLARISLVDLEGNEVGGSRLVAGSMLWVAEK
jgi:hypothetical protein